MSRRFVPAGSMAVAPDPVVVTPEDAGWTHCGLHVLALAPGERRELTSNDRELFVLPLSATGVRVGVDGETFELEGRTSVFARVSDFAYIGRETRFTVTSASGGEIALPSARCDRLLPPRYGPAEDVAVEVRGAGQATRQISYFRAMIWSVCPSGSSK